MQHGPCCTTHRPAVGRQAGPRSSVSCKKSFLEAETDVLHKGATVQHILFTEGGLALHLHQPLYQS
jgi:hypothetical protein